MTEFEIIKNCINGRNLRVHYPDLYNKIINHSNLINDYSFIFKCYWYLNNITQFPICPACNKPIIRKDITLDGYIGAKKYCSQKCYYTTEEYRDKYRKGMIEKYGVEHPLHIKEVKENIINYNKQHRQEINQKIKESMLNRTQEEINCIIEKYKKTCLEKYGVDNIQKVPEIHEKTLQKIYSLYGLDYHNNYRIKKSKETCLEKYGVDSYIKIPENKQRIIDCSKLTVRTKRFNSYIDNNENLSLHLFSLDDYCKYGHTHVYKWKCKKCGLEFDGKCDDYIPTCPKCYHCKSYKEIELLEYIKFIYTGEVIHCDRQILKPKEIDIYLPQKRIAIEFNGVYWHSEKNIPDKNYHLNKSLQCTENGIQLIHIFEDEWLLKRKLVESRIKSILGIYDKKIYARKCEIVELSNNEYKDFVSNNHLQGFVSAQYIYGLKFNNEIVSIMSFGHYRKNLGKSSVNNEFELLRFCNKCGYSVIGGASKLLKHFLKTINPDRIITYCDRRWSNGNFYRNIGFQLDHTSTPNYFYVKQNGYIRENRFKYRKNNLKNLLENFDITKSEHQNMLDNHYYRIYDCGNFVFELNKL